MNKVFRYRNILLATKKIVLNLLCHTYSVWQWILDNFLTDEEETWLNSDPLLQIDAENTMDETYQQRLNFKENRNTSWTQNQKRRFGEFLNRSTYWRQMWQKEIERYKPNELD